MSWTALSGGGRLAGVEEIRAAGDLMASEIVPDARQREQILDHYQHLLSRRDVVSLAVRVRGVPTLVVGVIRAEASDVVPELVRVEVTDRAGRKSVVELATEVVAEGEI